MSLESQIPALQFRVERIQVFIQLANELQQDSEQTANRIFGNEPQTDSEDAGSNGSDGMLAQMDLCLDELERALRASLYNNQRLARL